MSIAKFMVGFAAAVLCVGVSVAPAHAQGVIAEAGAPAPDVPAPVERPEAGWYAVLPSGELFVPGETESMWASPEPEPGTIGPMLLDPVDWFNCWTARNETHVIDSYPWAFGGAKKNMAIQCGKEENPGGQGYHHIRYEHEQQWRDRITQTDPDAGLSTDSWDDFMWHSAITALDYPRYQTGPTNGKVCNTTPIQMHAYDDNGRPYHVYTFNPTFSWSVTNDRIITAIPSTTHQC